MRRMNLEEIELSTFQTLNDNAVEYLVIGGCAMRFFGMDRYIDGTWTYL